MISWSHKCSSRSKLTIAVESGMQIDTNPLQINDRRLNVPRVLYGGVGGTAVSNIWCLTMNIHWSNTQNVRDGGWNVVGKQLSTPKSFNSWAVIDFVADKLNIDQIRDRVRALSSCCQQLGEFFLRCIVIQLLTLIHLLGMGMIIYYDAYIYTYLIPQALPFPLSRSNGAIPTSLKTRRYYLLQISVTLF